ncbi:hypothetical protein HanIR_Chr08g0370881 [Helianthus annuus]|nr:hypothetical protein HanIR_Chr08g0370881 [Helianthus annuus]
MEKVARRVGPGIESVELLKVKAVYVKNLPKNVTHEQLEKMT